MLKNEIQKKSETIVSLNEQIGKLAKADMVLKENEKLIQSEREAREKAKAIEDRYASKMAELERKEESIERDRRWLKYKSEEVEKTVASKLLVAEDELKSRVERKYKGVIIAVFIYGFIVTLIRAIKDGLIVEDAIAFGKGMVSGSMMAWTVVNSLALWMAKLAHKVPVEWLSVVLYWIVRISVVGAIIGGVGVIMFLGLRKYASYFKDNQMDCVSALASLCVFAIVSFAGRLIKSIISINLMVVMIVMFVMYSVIRWVMCMGNHDLRRNIIIWSIAAIWVVGVLVGMWMRFGEMALILLPVAGLVVMMMKS